VAESSDSEGEEEARRAKWVARKAAEAAEKEAFEEAQRKAEELQRERALLAEVPSPSRS